LDNFTAVLRVALSRRRVSQTRFAESLGVSQSYMSAVIAGKTIPSAARIIDIANRLEEDPARLLMLAGKLPPADVLAVLRANPTVEALAYAGARSAEES
jgi:transcriptional regulator with XRE-family HTH domain